MDIPISIHYFLALKLIPNTYTWMQQIWINILHSYLMFYILIGFNFFDFKWLCKIIKSEELNYTNEVEQNVFFFYSFSHIKETKKKQKGLEGCCKMSSKKSTLKYIYIKKEGWLWATKELTAKQICEYLFLFSSLFHVRCPKTFA